MLKYRRSILITLDYIIINIFLYLGLVIRFDNEIPSNFLNNYYNYSWIYSAVIVAILFWGKIYNKVWRYASVGEAVSISINLFLGTLVAYFLMTFFSPVGAIFPRGTIVISLMLNVLGLAGIRLAWRVYKENILNIKPRGEGKRIIIYGAGDAGHFAVKEIRKNMEHEVVGFVDDKLDKQGLQILGIPVLGTGMDLEDLVKINKVDEIIIAIPSLKGKKLQEVIKLCQKTEKEVRILPPVYDILEGSISVSTVREVQITDLLGRKPVVVDMNAISGYLKGKTVLITGAGGSIGSELSRQVYGFGVRQLILLDISENSLFDIEQELKRYRNGTEIIAKVKNLREGYSVEGLLRDLKPEIIFHAAAHKHVPLMEENPEEAVKNNIRGTYNLLKYANKYNVERVVVISTDKAVNPTNVMGATKRVTELLVQHFNDISNTNFMAVRFGNVLGSKGSVVPTFKKQIAMGGPVTVTHPEIIRYFMTIPEAVQLVIQSGAMAKGGEIFVLDMGEPVKIVDLAETLIRLSGMKPYEDIDIVFTGLRPGEKLYEELICDPQKCDTTKHEQIFVERLAGVSKEKIITLINLIEENRLPLQKEEIISLLKYYVPEYVDNNN